MNRPYPDTDAGTGGSRRRRLRPALLLLMLLCAAHAVHAAEPAGPWQVTADRLEQYRDSDRYIAQGNVTIARGGVRLNADRAVLDRRTMHAEAEGHVMLTSGQDVITGQRVEVDLAAETGTVYQGTVFLSENHFYIHGDRLEKLGPATYRGDRVKLTTCDGPDPTWRIQGRNLEVTVEGYGTMDHATFRAGDMPLFYAPKLIFPAKTKRQSGLLPPTMGFSDRLGAIYNQPFFWAIDEQQDATFYLNLMSRRGQMYGLEYRYVLGENSRGTLMYDFLDDRKVDDGTEASEDWAYDDTPARPNSDRYWLRGRIDQQLPGEFTAKLDLDLVSDLDYLHEFKSGPNGFSASDRVFERSYGRELDPYEARVRTNRLNLNRIWPQYSLNLDTVWRDDVAGRRDDGVNGVLQQLQSITFDGIRQPLDTAGLYFDLESQWRYYYLDNQRRSQRLDIHPRVYRPFRLGRFLAVEPSMGVRETAWYVETDSRGEEALDEPLNRGMVDFRLDTSSALYRVYHPGVLGIEALNHMIQPQLVYDYIPGQRQEKYPLFDRDLDRIDAANRVTAVLTQTFITRSQPPEAAATADESDGDRATAPGPVYREIGYIELSQAYDIDRARDESVEESRRPLSPMTLKVEFSPVNALSLIADVQRSPYSDHYDSRNIAVRVSDPRGDQLYVRHRYTYEVSESLLTRLLVPVTERLTSYTEWERNLHDDQTLETGVGMLYTRQCWALDLGYLYSQDSGREFSFMIHLYGLGGLGKDSVVARRIKDPFTHRIVTEDD